MSEGQPICVNINLRKGRTEKIIIRSNENPRDVGKKFAEQHNLGKDETQTLVKLLATKLMEFNIAIA